MVFAHVGFAADGAGFTVDYSKSCAQVFIDFAIHTAEMNGFIALLDLVWDFTSQPRLQDLPSWVADLAALSPTLRFPMGKSPGWEYETKVAPWGKNPAFISRDNHKISVTTTELLLSLIPADDRQTIVEMLDKIEILFNDKYCFEIKSEYNDVFKTIWEAVYQVWEGIVCIGMAPELSGPHLHSTRSFVKAVFDPSISIYLIMAFDRRFRADYLKRRALAKTDDGFLALVPVTTQKGDFIAPFVEGAESKHFVFRPVDYVDAEDDALLVRTAASHFDPEFYEGLEQQVQHCELVGECFVEAYWEHIAHPLARDNRGFIIEIH
jgi:hypothetical protein